MSDSFAPATVLEGAGHVLGVSHGDDSKFLVEFYTREIEDEKETAIHGRRILKPVAYCRKQAVGDPRTIWDAPAADLDKQRWPMLWNAYERGESEMVIGTPLDSWPLLTREARIALKNWGFKTVEQVSEVTDGSLLAMDKTAARVIASVREHAKKFIADQDSGEAERRLASELEKRDNEVGALKAQMAALSATIERMNVERLQAPVTPTIETGPGFQPPAPPEKSTEDKGLADLEALPALPEVSAVEPEAMPEPAPFSRKLSGEQIAEIQASAEANKTLAERYGVTPQTIARYRKA